MFQQTGWAAARNLCQIYAQTIGGQTGITIIQVTQVFNVMGSGGGYQLAASAFIAVLAEPEARTALFGVQGGVQMLGAAAGYVCEWEWDGLFAVAQPISADPLHSADKQAGDWHIDTSATSRLSKSPLASSC
jgi:hypothetical protein